MVYRFLTWDGMAPKLFVDGLEVEGVLNATLSSDGTQKTATLVFNLRDAVRAKEGHVINGQFIKGNLELLEYVGPNLQATISQPIDGLKVTTHPTGKIIEWNPDGCNASLIG